MHRFSTPRRRHAWRLRFTQLTIGCALVVGLCASALASVGAHAQQPASAATSSTSGPRAFPYRTPQNPTGSAATRGLTRSSAPRAGWKSSAY